MALGVGKIWELRNSAKQVPAWPMAVAGILVK